MSGCYVFVVGDIGGTKADIAAFELNGSKDLKLIKRTIYPTKDYPGIIDALKAFGVSSYKDLKGISIGIAGPVQGRVVRLTNLHWAIDADEIGRVFDCPTVLLINDLAAHAYGALHLQPEERLALQRGEHVHGNAAVIAPGTGLGEAIIYFDGKDYHPIATEGGHASFAPIDDLQMDVLRFAKKAHHHVSAERLISGSLGFPLLVDYFLQHEALRPEDRAGLERCKHSENVGGEICAEAEAGNETCNTIMATFASMLGAEASNLALKSMALGGVYLCGGIPQKTLRWLRSDAFTNGFLNKGRFRPLLSKLPIYVILDELNALKGLAHYALAKARIN